MIEKFPKFSGLNHTKAINLQKRTEKDLISIQEENEKDNVLIGDYINSRDTILFDLEFTEIWLEVEMVLIADDANKPSNKINFELKVSMEDQMKNLKNALIKMGIDTWKSFTTKENCHYDYYLFSNFKYQYIQSLDNKEYCPINAIGKQSVQNNLFQTKISGKGSFHLEDNIMPLNLHSNRKISSTYLKLCQKTLNDGINANNNQYNNNSYNNNNDAQSLSSNLKNDSSRSSASLRSTLSHCVELEDFSGMN